MQAEAAEAQSLKDADAIEQMQAAIDQLGDPKTVAGPSQQGRAAPEPADVQSLQTQVDQISKDIAAIGPSCSNTSARLRDVEDKLAALTADPPGTARALKASLHELKQGLAANEAGRAVDIERQAAVNMDVKGKVSNFLARLPGVWSSSTTRMCG